MGIVRKRKVVLYAGVSSRKDDLANQAKYLEENVKDHEQVITDVGPSLNVKRRGFLKLLRMIVNNEVSKVVITCPYTTQARWCHEAGSPVLRGEFTSVKWRVQFVNGRRYGGFSSWRR